jgi:hypothetical protein
MARRSRRRSAGASSPLRFSFAEGQFLAGEHRAERAGLCLPDTGVDSKVRARSGRPVPIVRARCAWISRTVIPPA